jgi:rhodanese-related sulfurtransferase
MKTFSILKGSIGFAILWGWIVVCPIGITWALGGESVHERLPSDFAWSQEIEGPMCGVYAASRAMKILGHDVDPAKLWNANYVGRSEGSTPGEIIASLQDCGFSAQLASSMSKQEIEAAGNPVIANVRKHREDQVFNHWVCVQSTGDGILVFDGPNPGVQVAVPEFLASWSGLGIVVSKSSYHSRISILTTRLAGMGCLLLTCMVTLGIGSRSKSCSALHPGSQQFGLVRFGMAVAASMAVGFFLYGVGPGHLSAMAIVRAPMEVRTVKSGTSDTIETAANDPSHLLIDARSEDSFSHGTIGKAANIPVYAGYLDVKAFLQDIPKDTPIVVFCQSSKCAYDEHIADVLVQIGFQDVTVADVGYAELKAAQGARSANKRE